MLIEFRVENHRSFRDEQAFTMEAGLVDDPADKRPRQVTGSAKPILPLAAIYGANASGKSNLLAAMAYMREVVEYSHRMWSPDEKVPREPFAWGPKNAQPSLYEATILIDGVRYQYGFLLSDLEVQEEWLYAWPKGKKQAWFEREQQSFQFGEQLKGENKIIAEITRSNSLFLSAAAQNKHSQIAPIYSWFHAIRMVGLSGRRYELSTQQDVLNEINLTLAVMTGMISGLPQPLPSNLEQPAAIFNQFMTMLKNADIGILEVRANREQSGDSKKPWSTKFRLRHQSDSDSAWLPLEEESRGTQKLFRIALQILEILQKGGLLLIDELETSLHPSLAQKIVAQFNSQESNPRNAQLIFTTHDTNLLGTTLGDTALRRDQVWLAEKDAEGASTIYPLTDFKPRKHENLEHGYLQGRYGAIPFLGNFSLTGE